MLAEVRALREAIVIADQLPTALASEVTKNTGLKLVHRLISQDDREIIGAAISASPLQIEQIASFSTGRALIYHEHTQKPFEVQIAKWIPTDIPFDFANDIQLYNQICDNATTQKAIISALKNWQYKYLYTMEEKLKELQKKYFAVEVTDIVEIALCKSLKMSLISECNILKKKYKRLKKLWLIDSRGKSSISEEFIEIYNHIEDMVSRLEGIRFVE